MGASQGRSSTDELVRLAHGAPGKLFDTVDRRATLERASQMLASAYAGREQLLRTAFVQGTSKARGAFSDVLDALTVLLHERARGFVEGGDQVRAMRAVRGVRLVEDAKRAAEGNVNPQLVTAGLLRGLSELGA